MRILFFDIETTTQEGHFFGNEWDARIIEKTREWSVLSFAWAWENGPVKYIDITETPGWKPGDLDDRMVVEKLQALMNEADVWVAHHGVGFDIPRMNTRFAVHGLGPAAPATVVDTKKEAARAFGRYGQSNSLEAWCVRLGIGKKTPHEGADLWLKCQAGDDTAWRKMKTYNKRDVDMLRKLYYYLRPYIPTLNMGFFEKGVTVCPTCGSKRVVARKYYRTSVSEFVQFRCSDCTAYSKERRRVPQRMADGTDIPLQGVPSTR